MSFEMIESDGNVQQMLYIDTRKTHESSSLSCARLLLAAALFPSILLLLPT